MLHALTVWQPWGTAIKLADPKLVGPEFAKVVENRSWAPPKQLLGKFIAIHAGKRAAGAEDSRAVWRQVYGNGAGPEGYRVWAGDLVNETGRILCVARVAGFSKDRKLITPAEAAQGERPLTAAQRRWWILGQIAWLLDDVRALARPILHLGKQGLWHIPETVEGEIRRQVAL